MKRKEQVAGSRALKGDTGARCNFDGGKIKKIVRRTNTNERD
jgi:hypothetical protein